ncbi:MAG TPA: PadR family transcriptional regulator [Syntrophomonadaceae bacterium]|nr:PadR family transcriptional regulator [Syntrophomonadaceae bacterium]
MIRHILSGFVRVHILYHASRERVYGAELMEELKRHGYRLSPGTVYPILHQMESSGWLASTKENIDGRRRIYYRITNVGEEMLQASRTMLEELVREVLPGGDRP